MGTIESLLKVKADATAAVRGLKPLQTTLEQTAVGAQETEKALADLSGTHKVSINDQALENTRKEITRLREQMRKSLSVDVNADTRDAQRRISQLQRSLKVLDSQTVVVPVDTESIDQARTGITGITSSLKGLATLVGGATAGKWLLDGALAASAFETNMRAVAAVLDDTTRIDVEDWITANADALNLSQVAASELARSLSLTAARFQDAGGDASEFLTTMERIAGEAAAFSDSDPGEVAAALGAAFRGEFDSMEQFGINLSQARVEAQALKDGLISAGEQMTPSVQTMATYNAILEDSGVLMGSAARNADTLGGKVSDLKQHTADLAKAFGNDLNPTLKDTAAILSEVTDDIAKLLTKRREWVDEAKQGADDKGGFEGFINNMKVLSGGAIFDVIDQAKDLGFTLTHLESGERIKEAREKAEALAAAVKKAKEEAARWDATVKSALGDSVGLFAQHQADLEDTAEHVGNLTEKYQDMVDAFSAVNQGLTDSRGAVYDYQGAIDDLAESLVEGKGSFAPDLEAGRTNWDNLVALAAAASTDIANTLKNKGADAARTVYENHRNTMHTMLVDAGVSSAKAWTLVDSTLKKPHLMSVAFDQADIKKLNLDIAKLKARREKLTFGMGLEMTPEEEARFKRDVLPKIKKIDVGIEAKQEDKAQLEDVANPKGKPRKAHIDAHVDPTSLVEANQDLDNFIKLRRSHVKIYVDVVPPSVGPSVGPTAVPGGTSLLAASTAMTATPMLPITAGGGVTIPVTAAAQPARETTLLRPKSTPVAVYLDGVEIAHRIEARRASAASESVRRSA